MKIISFALFGADPKYRNGMLANVRAAQTAMPDWRLLIYCDRINHEALTREDLGEHTECILQQDTSSGVEGMSWRFLAVLRPEAEVVIFRDADSLFSQREIWALNQWLSSSRDTHIIRDHPYHKSPVMGGLLGVRGQALHLLARLVRDRMAAHRLTHYGDDQVFLTRDFYPKAIGNALVHTNCVRYFPEFTQPLPPDQEGEYFIGAYAFLTPEEHAEYDRVRHDEPPITLLAPHWEQVPVLRKVLRKFRGVRRIKHGCRWCL